MNVLSSRLIVGRYHPDHLQELCAHIDLQRYADISKPEPYSPNDPEKILIRDDPFFILRARKVDAVLK